MLKGAPSVGAPFIRRVQLIAGGALFDASQYAVSSASRIPSDWEVGLWLCRVWRFARAGGTVVMLSITCCHPVSFLSALHFQRVFGSAPLAF